MAVNGDGDVLTSDNPTGGSAAWQKTRLRGEHKLILVSCPTASFCALGDDAGNIITSTQPTGGARVWHIAALPRYYVSVPGFPRRPVRESDLSGLSCPTAQFCAAVAADSDYLFSSDRPAARRPSWRLTALVHPNGEYSELLNITCPARNLCVSWDAFDIVHTSIDPTAGASAWTATPVEVSGLISNPLVSNVSCPTSTLCIAGAGDGTGLYSIDPAAPARHAAQPSISEGSVAGIAKTSPRLRFTATAGIPPAHAIKQIEIGAPRGVNFSTSAGTPGLLISDPHGRRLGYTATARRTSLKIILTSPASVARVRLTAPTIQASATLAREIKHRKLRTFTFAITTIDGQGRITHLVLSLAPA